MKMTLATGDNQEQMDSCREGALEDRISYSSNARRFVGHFAAPARLYRAPDNFPVEQPRGEWN